MLRSLAIFLLLASWLATTSTSAQASCADMYSGIGMPDYKSEPPDHVVLCRLGYVLSHNHENRTPDWVIERLTPTRFKGPGNRKAQGDPFAEDPDLRDQNSPRAKPKDYKKSGFDQGHMAPAATMKFSVKATDESFYLSNMAPQVGMNLNRHIWADLEALTREWTCDRGELIVITGPIYDKEPTRIGDNEVAVPTAFYKIAYEPTRRRAIAFILPNKGVSKEGKKAWDVLAGYRVTIREVEERSSLNFFEALPLRDKRRVRSSKPAMWPVVEGCT